MIQLNNRQILDDGTVLCTVDAGVELLYSGKSISHAIFKPDDDIILYNKSRSLLDSNLDSLLVSDQACFKDYNWYDNWNTPDPWASVSVLDYCIDKCTTDEQRIRVCEEYKLYEDREMIPVLCHLIWMVHYMRSNNILWGVGRGSSVSSYILYLIGIIRINPMDFNLDIREFLK